MNPRRSFLAIVGGSLAGAGTLITGAVRRAEAAEPTLLLPARMSIEPPAPVATRSPLLAKCKSEMHAVIDVKRHLPPEEFEAWLEGGLRQARLFDGRSLATMERRMEEAVERHGSIIAAMRAGAI